MIKSNFSSNTPLPRSLFDACQSMQQLRLTMILIPDKMYGVLKKAMFREYFWLNLPKCRYYRLKEKATRSWQRHLEVAGAEAPVAFRLWEGGKGHIF